MKQSIRNDCEQFYNDSGKLDSRPAVENTPPEGGNNFRKRMKDRNLSVGDTVLWRSYGTGPRWMPGAVAQVRDLRDSMLTREEVS
ncbi:hypothetical protein T07_9405 [Trichinella nelsoni]|uniref:Uncharacterized protein n=1 Tax=Trichinella nelsoni TaxID=6336 RepID=A0A0V0SMP6_9BILA|nr:hypothetical protein T07_9405 [Trichinella nelsoni]